MLVETKHYLEVLALMTLAVCARQLARKRATVAGRVVPPQQGSLGLRLLYEVIMAVRTPSVLLSQASQRAEAGDVVSAGCHAREALRRHLRSLCELHDCVPREPQASPKLLANALHRAGVLSEQKLGSLVSLATLCHRAAHCQRVRVNRMKRVIEAMEELTK